MKRVLLVASAALFASISFSRATPQEAPPALSDYGVSEKYPHGRAHPKAPKELAQFHFMVGDFERKERARRPDGSWGPWMVGEWNAHYFMNGHAIIDESFNHESQKTTTNLRFYDPREKKWKISWFTEPGYGTAYAEGQVVGDELVCTNPTSGARYVFYDITEDSYEWELRQLRGKDWIGVWQISMQRKQ